MQSPWRETYRSGGERSAHNRSVVVPLIVANVVLYFVQIFADQAMPGRMDRLFALSVDGLTSGYLWQPVTYMFLHGGPIHLLANMLVIYFAGRAVENILGTRAFLQLYFAAGVLGGLGQVLFTGGWVVGASAGGFALLIAFATLLPEMELTLLLFFILPVRLRAKYLAYGAVAVSLLMTVLPVKDGIGHLAHLIGCLVGYVFVRRLGHGRPSSAEQRFAERRDTVERQRQMSAKEFISEEIDPILEKISRHGLHSLSRSERETLERGREKIERKTSLH